MSPVCPVCKCKSALNQIFKREDERAAAVKKYSEMMIIKNSGDAMEKSILIKNSSLSSLLSPLQ